jgi:cytoskeletal protein CcmA (bactofilin family)
MQMNKPNLLAVDEFPFPPPNAVPHFLTVHPVSETASMSDKNDTSDVLPRVPAAPATPVVSLAPATPARDLPVRTLNLQAGAGVAPKAATPAAVEAAVCTFPAGLSFEGDATFPCDFAVMGTIKGKVALTGHSKLVIAAGGKVEGEIVAKSISIDGEANGKIDASGGLVSFGENARCTGSIQYGRMSMAEGAEVEATMKKVA